MSAPIGASSIFKILLIALVTAVAGCGGGGGGPVITTGGGASAGSPVLLAAGSTAATVGTANDTDTSTAGIQTDVQVSGLPPSSPVQFMGPSGAGRGFASGMSLLGQTVTNAIGTALFQRISFTVSGTYQIVDANGNVLASFEIIVHTSSQNRNPTASAGNDASAFTGSQVILSGSGSDLDGDTLTYQWSQTSGANVTLGGATTAQATFTPSVAGTYVFSLAVSDGKGGSASDSVTVIVTVQTVNRDPQASAGSDQSVETGTLVNLTATASDADGDTLTFQWVRTSGPAATLSGASTANASFTPTAAGTYVFSLTVSDGKGGSASDSVTVTVTTPAPAVSGKVTNGDGTPIAGATVFLVPASAVTTTAITAEGVLTGTAEAYDEPLEDAVTSQGNTFSRDVTDSQGRYSITNLPGKFYIHVEPLMDGGFLPGGSQCRIARTTPGTVDIVLSGSPPASSTYIGTTRCLTCHADHAGQKFTAHKLGIAVPGQLGGLQDSRNFPDYNDGIDLFTSATEHTGGTVVSFGDFDGTRGFDKYKVYVGAAPTQITTKRGEAWLWKNSATDKYTITLVNTANPADPNTPLHLPVELTYGGTVYKQRYLIEIPNTGNAPFNVDRSGRYPLLQFQGYPGISEGKDSQYDRTRAVFRDYHLDWLYNDSTTLFKVPSASNTFEAQCAACHMPGIVMKAPNAAGERLADGIEDAVNGEFDVDGDGTKNEMNIGCESCHGPGSAHADANNYQHIVIPEYLTPERANMICGFCHDRPQGNGSVADLRKDVSFNASDEFPEPGLSRDFYLTSHTSRKGPATKDFWNDLIHSKSHHQQYSDLLKSMHYRNDRQLLTCADCHDSHAERSRSGQTEFPHNLTDNPADPASSLCARCHEDKVIGTHTQEKVGFNHSSTAITCSDCHMPRTAKSGAGQMGKTLGTPTGASSDANIVYWMNDISSHEFGVVRKTWNGVAGSKPGNAMPAPYTNKCGLCHDVSSLKDTQPTAP